MMARAICSSISPLVTPSLNLNRHIWLIVFLLETCITEISEKCCKLFFEKFMKSFFHENGFDSLDFSIKSCSVFLDRFAHLLKTHALLAYELANFRLLGGELMEYSGNIDFEFEPCLLIRGGLIPGMPV